MSHFVKICQRIQNTSQKRTYTKVCTLVKFVTIDWTTVGHIWSNSESIFHTHEMQHKNYKYDDNAELLWLYT